MSDKPYEIVVQLSTFNGEKFLRPQIDSILGQEGIQNFLLLVHDDGSTDGTLAILQEYQEKYPEQIQVLQDEHLGYPQCFMHLMRVAPDASYYAFSDQDDVWLPKKLSRAIQALEEHPQAKLYCALRRPVDEKLNPLGITEMLPEYGVMKNFMYQNTAGGCTMVITQPFMKILRRGSIPSEGFHDSWIYKIADLLDGVVFDRQEVLLYRQHMNNTAGFSPHFWSRFHRWISQNGMASLFQRGGASMYATEILQDFSDLLKSEDRKKLILMRDAHDHFAARIQLLLTSGMPFWPPALYFWKKLKIIVGGV